MSDDHAAALACDLGRVATGAAALHLQYVGRLLGESRVVEASGELDRIIQHLTTTKQVLKRANELFARDSPDNT